MVLSWLDYVAFIGFLGVVISVSMYAGRREKTSEDYFLAGRKLTWWLIGFSLIASNISTEHFVGMAGKGYSLGLAFASYEWIAAVTLVIVAWYFLPKFLRCGIFTMPQFLEHRFGVSTRTIMAVFMIFAYVAVAIATVLAASAKALNAVFGLNEYLAVWLIGITAGAYTIYGGLKAVVWSDLLQGAALILGGIVVTFLALNAVGGLEAFLENSGDKLHTVLPWDHPEMPWFAIFIGGMWIPNLFYWGMNQYITQRALGAKNLAEAQKGVFLAAFLKLLIPLIIILPGIMALQIVGSVEDADQAFPLLIVKILPAGLSGLMLAALFGAVMSSLDSMLNSASTIFTMDIYKRFIKPKAPSGHYVLIGRVATAVCVLIGCLWAPVVLSFEKGVFEYIQKFWGFVSPGIVAAFGVGLLIRKAPTAAANGAMILGIPVYALLMYFLPNEPLLNHIGLSFCALAAFMLIYTAFKPMAKPVEFPVSEVDTRTLSSSWLWGCLIILATAGLYILFW